MMFHYSLVSNIILYETCNQRHCRKNPVAVVLWGRKSPNKRNNWSSKKLMIAYLMRASPLFFSSPCETREKWFASHKRWLVCVRIEVFIGFRVCQKLIRVSIAQYTFAHTYLRVQNMFEYFGIHIHECLCFSIFSYTTLLSHYTTSLELS